MEKPEDRILQRRRVIYWHNKVCLDGGDDRQAAWKKKLAEAVGEAFGHLRMAQKSRQFGFRSHAF